MADELPAAVRRAVDAANAHDLDAFLAAFTPDGAVNDWGREFRGPAAIRGWSQAEFTGVAVTLDVTSVRRHGSTVAVVAQVGGDGFNGPSTFTFSLAADGAAITLMAITA